MLTKAEIKRTRSLVHKKYRLQYRQFIIEGARLTAAALETGAPLDAVYLTAEFSGNPEHRPLIDQLKSSGYSWDVIPDRQLAQLADTVSPAGILALCPLPDPKPQVPDSLPSGPWLYLDGIVDPGNLGTLLRTAAWFGVTNIGLSAGSVDPWNPKVVRGGMGAHFYLELFPDLPLVTLKSIGLQLLGADMDGTPVDGFSPGAGWGLVLGGEARGLTAATRELIDTVIAIPRPGRGESLNAAVAGGILLEYLTRLRR